MEEKENEEKTQDEEETELEKIEIEIKETADNVLEPKNPVVEPEPKSETKNLRESLRLRKTDYLKQQVEKQRAAEDLLSRQISEEQKILDEWMDSIDDNMERTEESRKYNKEIQQSINTHIYAMHGITEDKMQGMRECKNAYYRGCAFSLFLLSVVLIVLCGVLHGFQADVTLFMLAYTAAEGALLSQEGKRAGWLHVCCRILYLFMFPMMMVMFICYELGYPEYDLFLPYAVIAGLIILILATASVFLYDPYRKDKKRIRDAKSHISEMERIARKEVRKNQKIREKEEKKEQKQQEKAERKERKQQEKEERRELKLQKKEEKKHSDV